MESGISHHHSKSVIGTAGCIIHPAGGDGELVYTPSLDLRVKPHPNDKITVGLMATRLSEDGWPHRGQLSWGAKLENKLKVSNRPCLFWFFFATTRHLLEYSPSVLDTSIDVSALVIAVLTILCFLLRLLFWEVRGALL